MQKKGGKKSWKKQVQTTSNRCIHAYMCTRYKQHYICKKKEGKNEKKKAEICLTFYLPRPPLLPPFPILPDTAVPSGFVLPALLLR